MTSSGKTHRRTVPGLAIALALVLGRPRFRRPVDRRQPIRRAQRHDRLKRAERIASLEPRRWLRRDRWNRARRNPAIANAIRDPEGRCSPRPSSRCSPGGSFSARSTITGEMRLGSTATPISGTFDVSGNDTRQTLTVAIPGAPTTTSNCSRRPGVSYVRKGALWFVKPADTSRDLSSVYPVDVRRRRRRGRVARTASCSTT